MLAVMILTWTVLVFRNSLWVNVMRRNKIDYGSVKSFVDDLEERGTVSVRVAFVLRSAEVYPLLWRFVLRR